jgi:uncharacterized protein YciI
MKEPKMFALILKYVKPLEDVDRVLPPHIEFLDKHFARGNFICSGPQTPRAGGFILCKAKDRAAVEDIVAEDPFALAGVAEYTIIEFTPSKHADGFEKFI